MGIASMDLDTDGVLAVALHGELDFTNVSQIASEVCTAIDTRRPAAVRVDLSGVTFLDSSGIGVLVRAMRAAEDVSAGFGVENPSDYVFDQLRCAGLLRVFGLPEPQDQR